MQHQDDERDHTPNIFYRMERTRKLHTPARVKEVESLGMEGIEWDSPEMAVWSDDDDLRQ